MEWWIWITRWIILNIRYSRLFWVYLKKHGENIDSPSIKLYIYMYKSESNITFKVNAGYYIQLLTTETMKLLGSTENKIIL